MESKKMIHYIRELQEIQRLAVKTPYSVLLKGANGMTIDAKSYIGMYALDFSQPIRIQSDDASFHEQIKNLGENVE